MPVIALSANTAWYLYNFRRGLIAALLQQSHEVWALAPEDEFSARLVELGCRVRNLPMNARGIGPLENLRALSAYGGAYRELKPDVALHFTIKPVIFGTFAARITGVPAIDTITGLGNGFLRKDLLTRVIRLLYRLALGSAQRVFFQNDEDRGLFVESRLVAAAKTGKVPGSGVDLVRFAPEPEPEREPEPTRAGVIFLFIGRMITEKGLVELINAARLVKAQAPDVVFRLLGPLAPDFREGVSLTQIRAWEAERLVDYLGETTDVRPHIAAADCVVLPSYREGTPRTLLEAAAMACPVVATDVTGCREVVIDGENGYLCRPRDPEDLADRLLRMARLTRADRAAMGVKGRRMVEERFDEHIVISAYLDEIVTALTRGRTARGN